MAQTGEVPESSQKHMAILLENEKLKKENKELRSSSESKISIGDTVVLKSNEIIKMSVIEIKEEKATCIWFDKEDKLQEKEISIQILKKS
ncbi:hypothetical protein ACNSOL_11600 (plasmid) [Aliarcobacter lanthieri]|uniref:hypothetical protein n=1 Tax=Aliarcobacter lanthieri TaxID=1355374 RepID=UPI003AAD753E